MEAVDFVQDLATGMELALVPADSLEGREIRPLERSDDLRAAERVVARKRLVLAQPAKLVEDAHAILVDALVALDLRELDLGTTGERRDHRLRDIAAAVGITERAANRIVSELVDEGYVVRERQGRRNRYQVETKLPLRHPLAEEHEVGDLLEVLVG